jgi:methylated-DNA-protein-cysteine methyltransferase-like protein
LKTRTAESKSLYSRIYSVVRTIPPGKVLTYGQVAKIAGVGKNYRLIGYALHNLPENSGIPWQRVVNRFGKISYAFSRGGHDYLQKVLLEREGIVFDTRERINLSKFGYRKGKLK